MMQKQDGGWVLANRLSDRGLDLGVEKSKGSRDLGKGS